MEVAGVEFGTSIGPCRWKRRVNAVDYRFGRDFLLLGVSRVQVQGLGFERFADSVESFV